jgi:hypothetical protein
LLPSRGDLNRRRLDEQKALLQAGTPRLTPIQVTRDGLIWDGHHAVRAAAEAGCLLHVLVIPLIERPVGLTILQLPVRSSP